MHFSIGAGVDGATEYLGSRGLSLLIHLNVLNMMEPWQRCAERAKQRERNSRAVIGSRGLTERPTQ